MTEITKQALLSRGFEQWPINTRWYIKCDSSELIGLSICVELFDEKVCTITLDSEYRDERVSSKLPVNTPIEDIDHLIRILKL